MHDDTSDYYVSRESAARLGKLGINRESITGHLLSYVWDLQTIFKEEVDEHGKYSSEWVAARARLETAQRFEIWITSNLVKSRS